jgi:hypothetical protein
MDPFPEQWELISLFESEPTLMDPGVPWIYNHVTFVLDRAGERIECMIHEADQEVAFRWLVGGRTVVQLELTDVVGLEVSHGDNTEGLTVTTSDAGRLLYIQISPDVSVVWSADTR